MNIIYRASKESGSIASAQVNWRLLSGVQLIWVEIIYNHLKKHDYEHKNSLTAKKGFQCLQPIRYLISLSNLTMCLKVENAPESYIGL